MVAIDTKNFCFIFYRSCFFLKTETHAFIRSCCAHRWHYVMINPKYFYFLVV